jgi:hypothetical protein
MQRQVTITLSDDLYEHAQRWAVIMHRDVPDTLTSIIADSLLPIQLAPNLEKPASSLTDREVLALTSAQMADEPGRRLGDLLQRQREKRLAEDERRELLALMQVYDQLWVRQSEALAEAVRRGLRDPLSP